MAKNLKAFMEKASQDKGLAKKVSKAKNAEELRSIMASEGFELTDSDINNVSGGGMFDKPVVNVETGDIKNMLSWVKNDLKQEIGDTYITGDNSKADINQNASF